MKKRARREEEVRGWKKKEEVREKGASGAPASHSLPGQSLIDCGRKTPLCGPFGVLCGPFFVAERSTHKKLIPSYHRKGEPQQRSRRKNERRKTASSEENEKSSSTVEGKPKLRWLGLKPWRLLRRP